MLLVAVLFLGSGYLTYWMYSWTEAHYHIHTFTTDAFYELWIGLPFAILSVALWVRPKARISLVVASVILLDCVAWALAHWTALYLSWLPNGYVNMAIAGFVGGLGVTLATGLGCARLRSFSCRAGGAVVGAIAAIPFGQLVDASAHKGIVYSPHDQTVLAVSFPVWQIAVGLWLYSYAESKGKLPIERTGTRATTVG